MLEWYKWIFYYYKNDNYSIINILSNQEHDWLFGPLYKQHVNGISRTSHDLRWAHTSVHVVAKPPKKPYTFVFWVLYCEHWTCSSDLFCGCSRRQWCIPGRQYRGEIRNLNAQPIVIFKKHAMHSGVKTFISIYWLLRSCHIRILYFSFMIILLWHPDAHPWNCTNFSSFNSLGLGLRPAQSSFISTPEWTGVCRLCAFIWF